MTNTLYNTIYVLKNIQNMKIKYVNKLGITNIDMCMIFVYNCITNVIWQSKGNFVTQN